MADHLRLVHARSLSWRDPPTGARLNHQPCASRHQDIPRQPALATCSRGPMCMMQTARIGASGSRLRGSKMSAPPAGPRSTTRDCCCKRCWRARALASSPLRWRRLTWGVGRLVRLAGHVWPASFAYYLVYPGTNDRRPKIAAFRDWIMACCSSRSDGRAIGV
jgi:DNA-binding transcriptional LysR family regulator